MIGRATLLSGLLLLSACEQQNAPSTRADAVTATATASVATSHAASAIPSATATVAKEPIVVPSVAAANASATVSATVTASAAVPVTTTLARVAGAAKLKLRRLGPSGGSEASATVDDPKKVRALLAAIGTSQAVVDACPRCIPSVQIAFEDAFGTRLGSLGLFCSDQPGKPTIAALRDALADSCETLTVAAPDALQRLIDEALGPAPPAEE